MIIWSVRIESGQTGLNCIVFLPASTGDEQHQLRPGSWVETVILKEIRRKADVQESSQRAEVDISVWRLKIFQSTPGIEPRTFSYVCQHTTHTPPPRPFLNFKVENNIALMLVICFELYPGKMLNIKPVKLVYLLYLISNDS